MHGREPTKEIIIVYELRNHAVYVYTALHWINRMMTLHAFRSTSLQPVLHGTNQTVIIL